MLYLDQKDKHEFLWWDNLDPLLEDKSGDKPFFNVLLIHIYAGQSPESEHEKKQNQNHKVSGEELNPDLVVCSSECCQGAEGLGPSLPSELACAALPRSPPSASHPSSAWSCRQQIFIFILFSSLKHSQQNKTHYFTRDDQYGRRLTSGWKNIVSQNWQLQIDWVKEIFDNYTNKLKKPSVSFWTTTIKSIWKC